ncbi:MAG: NUDIX hydrolase [Candidatus Margulisiibacteriota bacterium]
MSSKAFVHKGRIFDFVREKITLPNGITKLYDFVKHRGAVVIIPLISRDKVVIIRQFRVVVNQYIYELPAGSIDKGEKPLACAKRELIEETGYRATAIKKIGKLIPCPGYSTEVLHIFQAKGLVLVEAPHATPVHGNLSPIKCDPDEIIEPLIVSRSQIRKMFRSGKILDAKTIASFAMIGWL